ncbi:DUF3826 domain-containing protein [Paradesertivirga mongoliensis]|uniref:DUF3826 domain-containing protein n=1 Tax=Paradesertivirga mongoliensis TaxID=2100740 RepID=A0ABW4ZPA7_9SPHI|nr:DUF3826 domain-containing protein [Pedobacter mongoliensis]
MNQLVKRITILSIVVMTWGTSVFSQETATAAEKEAAYTKVITERADKIVQALSISDQKKALKVRDIIAGQYRGLNNIHEARKASVKSAKEINKENRALADSAVKKIEEEEKLQLSKLHTAYLKSLSAELNPQQVEAVKDGMTYRVLPITYNGYLQMLPNLTEDQKKQILAYLTEAREFAMDAESSEKKHGWFGKYKGKINNYLSAAGINMKQASIDWQNRIKQEEAKKKM